MAELTAAEKRIKELEAEIAARDQAEADRQQAAQEAAVAQALADQEAAERKPDETIPGGRYLQGDIYIDAEGKPLKDQK